MCLAFLSRFHWFLFLICSGVISLFSLRFSPGAPYLASRCSYTSMESLKVYLSLRYLFRLFPMPSVLTLIFLTSDKNGRKPRIFLDFPPHRWYHVYVRFICGGGRPLAHLFAVGVLIFLSSGACPPRPAFTLLSCHRVLLPSCCASSGFPLLSYSMLCPPFPPPCRYGSSRSPPAPRSL